MPILEAIILGIVQGLTEFLPVSSTAHLALTPWLVTRLGLANWSDPGLTFDVALHAGTLFAILLLAYLDPDPARGLRRKSRALL